MVWAVGEHAREKTHPSNSLTHSNVSAGLIVGVGVGAGATYLLTRPDARPRPAAPFGPTPSSSHPALRQGAPPADALREFPGFAVGWDARARVPRWVAEHLTRDTARGDGDRSAHFFAEDAGLDARWRPTNADYAGTPYDRGHMAPAADFKGDAAALGATFTLTNAAPQVGPGFNRDYWARFERFVKTLATADGGGGRDVIVFSGPLWLPSSKKNGDGTWEVKHAAIGTPPRLVSVPTHFYKVVLVKAGPLGRAAVGAFVVPNAPIDPAAPLTAFTVPLSALEDAAGARFFADVVDGGGGAASLDAAAARHQAAGRAARARLPAGEPAALLPRSHAAGPVSAADPAPPRGEPAHLPTPEPRRGRGRPPKTPPPEAGPVFVWPGKKVSHVCDATRCQLPAEEWWKEGKKRAAGEATK